MMTEDLMCSRCIQIQVLVGSLNVPEPALASFVPELSFSHDPHLLSTSPAWHYWSVTRARLCSLGYEATRLQEVVVVV